jgi:hypothetical protein
MSDDENVMGEAVYDYIKAWLRENDYSVGAGGVVTGRENVKLFQPGRAPAPRGRSVLGVRRQCSRCGKHLMVTVHYNDGKVCDSWGAVLFDDETVCDCCLGECPEGCVPKSKG